MSWDLFAARIPSEWLTTADVVEGWKPPTIGTRRELIERIKQLVPGADFSDPTWVRVEGPGYSIEINLAGDEPLTMIGFFVRGGDSAPFAVAEIITGLGLRAFDTGADDGAIFPGANITEGYQSWRTYRDRVIGN